MSSDMKIVQIDRKKSDPDPRIVEALKIAKDDVEKGHVPWMIIAYGLKDKNGDNPNRDDIRWQILKISEMGGDGLLTLRMIEDEILEYWKNLRNPITPTNKD